MFHTVVQLEAGTGTVWQAELLAYSFHRAGEPGPLTMLVCGGTHRFEGAESIPVGNWRSTDGEDYAPINRPYALQEWLGALQPIERTVLLVDPDVLWLRRLPDYDVVPGAPVAQDWSSNGGIGAFSRRVGGLDMVGVPIFIDVDDLRAILPRWIAHTRALRSRWHEWMAEMYGWMLAARELGLRHQLVELDCFTTLHYYRYHDCAGSFDKYAYRPWELVTAEQAPEAIRVILNEYASKRRVELEVTVSP